MEKSNVNKEKVLKITGIVFNSLFYLVIVVLLVFSIMNLATKNEYDVPSFFGNGYVTVVSDSMAGDEKDSFTKNDLLIVKKVTDKKRNKLIDEVEIGDVVTFKYYLELERVTILNTHRVVDIVIENGVKFFITQGDGNVKGRPDKVYDKAKGSEGNDSKYYEVVNTGDVQAIYKSHVNGLGKTMKYIQTKDGFLLCILMPTAALFILQAFILFNNFNKIKRQKMSDKHKVDLESELIAERERILAEERERIRAEILAEEVKKNGNNQKESEE